MSECGHRSGAGLARWSRTRVPMPRVRASTPTSVTAQIISDTGKVVLVPTPQHRLAPARESPVAAAPAAEAFEAFFRRNYRSLVGFLLVSDFPFDIAEEAAQDAMAAANWQWGELTHPGSWVRVVALRQAVRAAAQQRQRRLRDLDHVRRSAEYPQGTTPASMLEHQ